MNKKDQSDWVCKIHRLPDDARRDPIRYAANVHPSRCATHPTLEKKYFIVADELQFLEEGVAIAHIDWDGKTSGKTEEQLLSFGRSFLVGVQRAAVPDNASQAATGTVCMLAQGYRTWQPKVKQFAIYYQNSSDADIKLAMAIDPRWDKRGHGEARVALGGHLLPEEIEKAGGFWPALIRSHVAMCKKHKFEPAFNRQHFIWCEDETPSAKSEVQVVQLDWNGDARLVDTLAEEYKSKATGTKVVASKAHKMLADVVDGAVEWKGEAVA